MSTFQTGTIAAKIFISKNSYINRTRKFLLLFIFLLAGNAVATNFTVTNSADTGAGTLRNMVAATVDGDTVSFDAGVTYITLTSGRINVNDSIHIIGPGPENLTIDGNANDRGFYMAQAGVTSTVSGITITNCAITGATTKGGAIYLGASDTGHLTVSNCVITGCTSGAGGSGIAILGGKSIIINTTITGCSATNSSGDGGAIYNNADVYMRGCIISGNTAIDDGGGVFNTSKFIAENCTISGNTSGAEGGGLRYYVSGSVTNTLINCIISSNIAAGDGGGMEAYKANLDISNCVITANSGGDDGGGIYLNAVKEEWDTHIWNTTVSTNSSHDFGGGLAISDQNVWIYNSTFSDNATTNGPQNSDGGAIYLTGGYGYLFVDSSLFCRNHSADDGGAFALKDPAELRNCTISDNISDDQGGGLYIWGASSETQKIYNCTIYDNTCATSTKGGGIYRSTSVMEIYSCIIASNAPNNDIKGDPAILNYSLYNNMDGTPASTTGCTNGSPELVALADNGGPTLTHALVKGSIAIDAGSNPLLLAYDQRGDGFPREDGNPDIGAYEYAAGFPKGATIIVK